jgi:hypothetical protein
VTSNVGTNNVAVGSLDVAVIVSVGAACTPEIPSVEVGVASIAVASAGAAVASAGVTLASMLGSVIGASEVISVGTTVCAAFVASISAGAIAVGTAVLGSAVFSVELVAAVSGAVVVAVSVLLVLQAPRSPATSRQVME